MTGKSDGKMHDCAYVLQNQARPHSILTPFHAAFPLALGLPCIFLASSRFPTCCPLALYPKTKNACISCSCDSKRSNATVKSIIQACSMCADGRHPLLLVFPVQRVRYTQVYSNEGNQSLTCRNVAASREPGSAAVCTSGPSALRIVAKHSSDTHNQYWARSQTRGVFLDCCLASAR